jgi:hypothetical protein
VLSYWFHVLAVQDMDGLDVVKVLHERLQALSAPIMLLGSLTDARVRQSVEMGLCDLIQWCAADVPAGTASLFAAATCYCSTSLTLSASIALRLTVLS